MLLISLKLLVPSFLGALGQEILHWYNLSRELGNNVKLFNSKQYWLITLISILFFGFTSGYLVDFIHINSIKNSTKLFLIGFSYPIIIKYILKIVTKSLPNNREEIDSKNMESLNTSRSNINLFKSKNYFSKF